MKLIAWQTCKDELESFEVKETISGRESFGSANRRNESGVISHDDIPMAMIMSNLMRKEWQGFTSEITMMSSINDKVQRVLFDEEID